ncbi:hypothetical protein DOY81_008766, partial [Sarcophaga bullata]
MLTSAESPSKILAVFGLPAPARYDFVAALLNALSDRGHQVTLILRFASDWKLRENITQIIIKENQAILTEFTYFSSNYMDNNFFSNLQIVFGNCTSMNGNIFKNPQVKQLMQEEQKFDLILLDILLSDSLYGLGEHFNAPMVGVSNYCTWLTVDALVGNISPASFIPSVLIQHAFEVNFMQRCLNFALDMINEMIYNFMYLNQQHILYKELFPNARQTFAEVRRNFSLVILNHHVSLSFARPYVPNMIEAAGLHIEEKNLSALPLTVQQFMVSSNQPVIYFYLDIDPTIFQLSAEQTLLLHNAFKDLNYKVIWHANGNIPSLPAYENILFVSNISHFALLAHPQVKLFITSGDTINFIEAVYYAKPLLGIPVFANHRLNINMAINGGYGLGLSPQQLSVSKLKLLITELLTKPQYQYKVKQVSALLHDQPLKPKELAIYWIEYVLRHKGAIHLRVKGRFLSFWQFYNIDVILAFIAVFASIVFCIR